MEQPSIPLRPRPACLEAPLGCLLQAECRRCCSSGVGAGNLILLYSPPAKSLLIIHNLQKPWEEESDESMSFFWKSACATACEVMSSGAHTLCCLQGFGLCPELPQPHSLWDPRTGASKLPAQPAACTSLQTVLTERTLRLGFRKSGFGSQLNHAFLSWCDSD